MAKDFDKQKWATEQEALKQKLTDTVNDIIANYEDSPEEIAELLAFKAKFHSYSVGNAILMQKQNPYAAFVASFQKFKEMGYSVKKGEHGMKIFVPVTVTLLKDEGGSWTPLSEASDELKRQAKAGLTEKRTVTRYKLGTVFDISQTNCPVEDYPQIYHVGYPSERHGLLTNALTAFCEQALHCPVTQENLTSISLHGRYIHDGRCIVLNDKLEDTHRLCTLTHEMGHAVLHDTEKVPTVQAELEADAFSILLESYLGIPLTDTRKRHLAGHYQQLKDERSRDPDLPTLTEMLKRACSRFNELLPEMQKYLPKDNRYQIITYSRNIGTDEKRDYATLSEAQAAVQEYLAEGDDVIIYDLKEKRIAEEHGYFPPGARPLELTAQQEDAQPSRQRTQ